MTETQGNWDRMDGFAKATESACPHRDPTSCACVEQAEDAFEDALGWCVSNERRGEGFAFFAWTTCLVYRIIARVQEHGSALAPSLNELRAKWDEMQRRPRMRKEFVPLFDGDVLIGQMTIERPFEARDNLPFVERVHPDDVQHMGLIPGGPPRPKKDARVQRFYLENGRYRLEQRE